MKKCFCKIKKDSWYPKCSFCLKRMTPLETQSHYKNMNNYIKTIQVQKNLSHLNINCNHSKNSLKINYIRKFYTGITHGINAYLHIPSTNKLLDPLYKHKYKELFKERHNIFHKGNKPKWLMKSNVVVFNNE